MKAIWAGICLGVLVLLALPDTVFAEAQKAYNIRMRRADMPDTTDVASIIKSVITDKGITTDVEKAKAIWRVVFQFTHQDGPPQEEIAGCTHDIIKLFNVYGYRMCCCASECVETLATAAGFSDMRTMQIKAHNVPELYYGGLWHMFDSSLINYFKWDTGVIASVDDIHLNPGTLINQAHCPTGIYGGGGWYPALTHNLTGALDEYSQNNGEAADGFSNGWQVGHKNLLTLREGETLERDCLNDGTQHHINEPAGGPGCITLKGGTGDGQYFNWTIPDQSATYYYVHPLYHGGVVGNGTLTYDPSLADGGYRGGIESETNIACTFDDSQGPAVHLAATGTGTIIIRMACPYVFLGGTVDATLKRAAGGDSVKVYISTNNMLDWTQIYNETRTGSALTANINVKTNIYKRYCYYLKFEFISAGAVTNVGMDALTITNLIQHAQRAMPFLVQGNNDIVVDAGTATQTLSIAPRVTTATVSPTFTANETLTTMHAVNNLMTETDGGLWSNGAGNSVTFPVSCPGDITAVRFGATFRLRDSRENMALEVSTTGPATGFVTVATVNGADVKKPFYVEYTAIPAGKKNCWVRFTSGAVYNATGISGHVRIDADYTEAGATIRPFKIKHEWTEGGNPMSHTETITSVPHTYSINCVAEPTMTAVTTWVDHSVLDMTAPNVTISKAVLYGKASDAVNRPAEVIVNGTAHYTVNQTNGSWQTTDTTFTNGVAIPITAADASGNTRTVNVTVSY